LVEADDHTLKRTLSMKEPDPHIAPPGVPPAIKVLLGGIRRRFHRHYIGEYLRLTGASQEKVDEWELPVLAARLMEWLPESEKQVLIARIHEKLNRL
jgi:hypothetical protein